MAATTVTANARIANYSVQFFAAKCLHKVGTDWYIVGEQTAPGMTVYRSTNDGTSFTEQDTSHRQTTASSSRPFDSCLYNGKLYVASMPTGTTVSVDVFDTATNLWTTGLGDPTTAMFNTAPMRVVARSNGHIVLVYTSNADPSDVMYATWNGSSWTADVVAIDLTTAGVTSVWDAVVDRNDNIVIFARDATNVDLLYVTLNSSNVLSSVQTLNANVSTSNCFSTGSVYQDGSADKYILPFLDSNADPATYTVTLGASVPLTTSGPNVVAAKTGSQTAASGLYVSGAERFVWYDETATEINYATNTAGTWGSLTQLVDGTWVYGQAIPNGSEIVYVYNTGSTLSFDRFTPPSLLPTSSDSTRRIRSQFQLRPY